MRGGIGVLVVLISCAACLAQLSEEEAYQRLKERQKEHAAAASQPAGQPPHVAQAQRAQLLHDAWGALVPHRYAAAIPIFDRSIAVDSKDTVALQGRGICHYELKQSKQADRDLSLAYTLSTRGGAKASRQLSIALAAASTMNDNPMRAVRIIREMMEALDQDSKVDEQLQNFLGIALSKVTPQARKQPYFVESQKYYTEYDQKLARDKKDDTARWGTKWVQVGSAEKKWTQYNGAIAEAEQAASAHDHAVLGVSHARELMIELHGLRLHSDAERNQWTAQYKESLANEGATRIRLAKAIEHLNTIEKPPFPARIEYDWAEPR